MAVPRSCFQNVSPSWKIFVVITSSRASVTKLVCREMYRQLLLEVLEPFFHCVDAVVGVNVGVH